MYSSDRRCLVATQYRLRERLLVQERFRREQRELLEQLRADVADGKVADLTTASDEEEQNEQDQNAQELSFPWNDTISLLLCGTRDAGSSLSALQGLEDSVLRKIYGMVVNMWKQSVVQTLPAYSVGRMPTRLYRDDEGDDISESEREHVYLRRGSDEDGRRLDLENVSMTLPMGKVKLGNRIQDRPRIAFSLCGTRRFPEPRDLKVNMLPFVLGDKTSLPDNLQHYHEMIESCPVQPDERGKVCYLTVCEGHTEVGATQRRGGLHVEAPNMSVSFGNTGPSSSTDGVNGTFVAAYEHHWGQGVAYTEDELVGGFFMASTLENSCAVYNALVDDKSVLDSHGGMDHLRPLIGEPTKLEANCLVWLTDCTPHEALPQESAGYRQFFRLVTSQISVWYADHSTENPKVALPKDVKIIHGSKFQTKPTTS